MVQCILIYQLWSFKENIFFYLGSLNASLIDSKIQNTPLSDTLAEYVHIYLTLPSSSSLTPPSMPISLHRQSDLLIYVQYTRNHTCNIFITIVGTEKEFISYFIKITAVSTNVEFSFQAFSRKFLYNVSGEQQRHAVQRIELIFYQDLLDFVVKCPNSSKKIQKFTTLIQLERNLCIKIRNSFCNL